MTGNPAQPSSTGQGLTVIRGPGGVPDAGPGTWVPPTGLSSAGGCWLPHCITAKCAALPVLFLCPKISWQHWLGPPVVQPARGLRGTVPAYLPALPCDSWFAGLAEDEIEEGQVVEGGDASGGVRNAEFGSAPRLVG